MIRFMQHCDTPDVLALLEWMDGQADREVLAPEARDPQEFELERHGKTCFVSVDDLGQVNGYCALARLDDQTLVLEGPLGDGPLFALLRRTLQEAAGSVYAFSARDNVRVRDVLEQVGFYAMHSTDFYRLRRERFTDREVTLPGGVWLDWRLTFDEHRALYRVSEDAWSERLEWSYARFVTHASRDDVAFLVLRRDGQALGFAEVEWGEVTHLTYVAVHPVERGCGLGRALLQCVVQEVFSRPDVLELRTRAHDHELVARKLYHQLGFDGCRCVVTYWRDG